MLSRLSCILSAFFRHCAGYLRISNRLSQGALLLFFAGIGFPCAAANDPLVPMELRLKGQAQHDEPYYYASTGERFPWHHWVSDQGEIKAVVVAIPGMGGAASEFNRLGKFLQQDGIAVYALDLRGQGLDPVLSRRGSELNVDQLTSDIRAAVKEVQQRHPNVPVVLYGESMGALLTIRLLSDQQTGLAFKGAILSAPVVELAKPPSPMMQKALSWGSVCFPSLRLSPDWFKQHPSRFSHDPGTQRHLETAPYRVKTFTLSFLESMNALMASANRAAEHIQQPVLVLGAGDDDYIAPQQLRQWFKRIGSQDKTLSIFPQSYHLLLFDLDQEAVQQTILSWLNQHLKEAVVLSEAPTLRQFEPKDPEIESLTIGSKSL